MSKRRKFLKKASAFAATIGTGTVTKARSSENGKTVKLLSPEGKLIEVPAHVFEESKKESIDNKGILDWRQTKGE